MGTSTPYSELYVLVIPHVNDTIRTYPMRRYETIREFDREISQRAFQTNQLVPLARRLLSVVEITKEKDTVGLRAKVLNSQGETRFLAVRAGSTANLSSTNYIRLAFQLDPRQILVYHWLYAQAQKYNLIGGSSVSAFHLHMLILHFAQVEQILPVLMDSEAYAHRLSGTRHWSDLVGEYSSAKNDLTPLYTVNDVDKWAPVLMYQLVEYYASIDFTKVEIEVGRASVKERSTDYLLLIDPFQDQELGVCRVKNGAALMNKFFAKLKDEVAPSYFKLPTVTRFAIAQSIVGEIEKTGEQSSYDQLVNLSNEKKIAVDRGNINKNEEKTGEQSRWTKLADLSYGEKTITHREKLQKTLNDLRRELENSKDSHYTDVRELKLVAIGSFIMGTFTPSSDLDVLIIPYSNDRTTERIEDFNRNMRDMLFRKKQLFPTALRISDTDFIKGKADVYLNARVPIIHGTTRSGVSFDLQIGLISSLYSSNLVRVAFQLDPRLILVYHWLRAQTEQCKLFGGSSGLFTAFHLYMLILHSAQATKILPVLMDEYAHHLSNAGHWRDIINEYGDPKNVLTPVYTTNDPDRWAPVLIHQLVEYYSSKDFTKTEIDVGRGTVKERSTDYLVLIDPFHDQDLGVCGVRKGAARMNKLFARLKNKQRVI